MELLQKALAALPQAATSGTAAILYVIMIVAIVGFGWRIVRNKQVLQHIKAFPESDRLAALEMEMGAARLATGLTPEAWLRSRIHSYYFAAFVVACVTGVLVLLIAVLAPPTRKDDSPGDQIVIMASAMNAAYSQGSYDGADHIADEILKFDPKYYRALNMKGIVAFYAGNFPEAARFFQAAYNQKPTERSIVKNLGDANIEIGGYQKAIDLFASIEEATPEWSYKMGRARLYADDFAGALKYFQTVPTQYERGKARILEAAALAGLSAAEPVEARRRDLIAKARAKLKEGVQEDKEYWAGVLGGKRHDIHETYRKAGTLLKNLVHSEGIV